MLKNHSNKEKLRSGGSKGDDAAGVAFPFLCKNWKMARSIRKGARCHWCVPEVETRNNTLFINKIYALFFLLAVIVG